MSNSLSNGLISSLERPVAQKPQKATGQTDGSPLSRSDEQLDKEKKGSKFSELMTQKGSAKADETKSQESSVVERPLGEGAALNKESVLLDGIQVDPANPTNREGYGAQTSLENGAMGLPIATVTTSRALGVQDADLSKGVPSQGMASIGHQSNVEGLKTDLFNRRMPNVDLKRDGHNLALEQLSASPANASPVSLTGEPPLNQSRFAETQGDAAVNLRFGSVENQSAGMLSFGADDNILQHALSGGRDQSQQLFIQHSFPDVKENSFSTMKNLVRDLAFEIKDTSEVIEVGDKKNLKITLRPHHLGEVKVELAKTQQGLKIYIVTSTEEARNHLNLNKSDLMSQVSKDAVSVDIQSGLGDFSGNSEREQSERNKQSSPQIAKDEEENLSEDYQDQIIINFES